VQTVEVGGFTVRYHRANNVIPRFPPLAILCQELHTLVIKASDQHVAVHIGVNEDGMIQCFIAHNGMTARHEVSQHAHFLFDFNFAGQHFMLLHYPSEFAPHGEATFELSVLGQSLVFSHTLDMRIDQGEERSQAVIYNFPRRVH
jgi:hypothetical protein